MTHKLIAKYDESLGRKVWQLACGAPLEGAKVKQQWGCVKCPACKKLKRPGTKRINIQELLAKVGA